MDENRSYRIVLFADDDSSRSRGLMHTDPLPDGECALFRFPRQADHAFWNHNVSYPLTIVFCDVNLRVLAIREMGAMSRVSCRANSSAVKYVIEARAGTMDDIVVGDRLVIDPNTMTLQFQSDL